MQVKQRLEQEAAAGRRAQGLPVRPGAGAARPRRAAARYSEVRAMLLQPAHASGHL
jgi:hypothetical protein